MDRARTFGLLFVCCLLAAPAVGSVALGQGVLDARLTVADVAVSPETPVTGAPVTVDATVRLSAGSGSPVSVERVFLRTGDGERRGVARGVGSLSPGETVTVPLTTTFEDAGRRDLSIVVVGENESGATVRIAHPATVVVEQAPPLVEVRTDGGVSGVAQPVGVRVANPTTAPLRNVVVAVRTDGGVERRTLASLAAGGAETVNVSVRPARAGERSVAATVAYTTARGTRAETSADASLSVAPLREDVGVRVEPVRQGRSRRATSADSWGVSSARAGRRGSETTATRPPTGYE